MRLFCGSYGRAAVGFRGNTLCRDLAEKSGKESTSACT